METFPTEGKKSVKNIGNHHLIHAIHIHWNARNCANLRCRTKPALRLTSFETFSGAATFGDALLQYFFNRSTLSTTIGVSKSGLACTQKRMTAWKRKFSVGSIVSKTDRSAESIGKWNRDHRPVQEGTSNQLSWAPQNSRDGFKWVFPWMNHAESTVRMQVYHDVSCVGWLVGLRWMCHGGRVIVGQKTVDLQSLVDVKPFQHVQNDTTQKFIISLCTSLCTLSIPLSLILPIPPIRQPAPHEDQIRNQLLKQGLSLSIFWSSSTQVSSCNVPRLAQLNHAARLAGIRCESYYGLRFSDIQVDSSTLF